MSAATSIQRPTPQQKISVSFPAGSEPILDGLADLAAKSRMTRSAYVAMLISEAVRRGIVVHYQITPTGQVAAAEDARRQSAADRVPR